MPVGRLSLVTVAITFQLFSDFVTFEIDASFLSTSSSSER